MIENPSLRFVDTNVIVYAYDISAGERYRHAKSIIDGLWLNGAGCLSIQVLQEFYVTATLRLGVPLDQGTAAQIVRDLSRWHIHAPDADDVSGAIDIHQRFGISFWDAMIIRSAAHFGCGVLLTEDLNHGQEYDGVRAHNPFT